MGFVYLTDGDDENKTGLTKDEFSELRFFTHDSASEILRRKNSSFPPPTYDTVLGPGPNNPPNMVGSDNVMRVNDLDKDMIRPKHYGGKDNPYEVFKVVEAWGLDKDAYLFNVVKYVARAGKKDKDKELEDLEKALVYLKRKIDNIKEGMGS